jgi:hypothetical protein
MLKQGLVLPGCGFIEVGLSVSENPEMIGDNPGFVSMENPAGGLRLKAQPPITS